MAKKATEHFNKMTMSFSEMEDIIKEDPVKGLKTLKANFGDLAARLTMLNIAVKEKLKESYMKNYPPSIFIAYKWEDETHNEWVKNLARYLELKGYDVLLDQDHLASTASNYEEVPQYIARMVSCDLFLIVITEKYVEFIEARNNKTTWVYDEYQQAVLLHNHGKLNIQAIWKGGNDLPAFFARNSDTIDMRNGSSDFTKLDRYFPNYEGRLLSDDERIQLRAFLNRFDSTLNLNSTDPTLLAELLNTNSKFASLYDYQFRLMTYYWYTENLQEAYNIAFKIREESSNDDHIIMLARLFDCVNDLPTLFKFLHNARRRFYLKQSAAYHYLCATTLYEQNSIFAARNHFGYLTKMLTGRIDISESLAKDIRDKYDELSTALSQYSPKHLFRCSECIGEYFSIGNFDKVCGDCGTEYELSLDKCPVCNNDGIISLQWLIDFKNTIATKFMCPVCHKGELVQVY